MAKSYVVTNQENNLTGILSDGEDGKIKISWEDDTEELMTNEEIDKKLEDEEFIVEEVDINEDSDPSAHSPAQASIETHSSTTAPDTQADGNPKTRLEWILQIVDGLSQMDMQSLETLYFAQQQAQVGGEAAKAGIKDASFNQSTIVAKPSDAVGKGFLKTEEENLFKEMELTEEGKVKVATLFETALTVSLAPKVAEMQAKFDTALEENIKEVTETLVEKIDQYLDRVVNEWVQDNSIAIESSLRTQLTEEFIMKLKDLFVEHYIEIPEEKVDVLESIVIQNNDLTEEMNKKELELMEKDKVIKGLNRSIALNEAKVGLTLVQQSKLDKLTEGVDFDTTDLFKKKVTVIKESITKEPSKDTGIDAITNIKTEKEVLNEINNNTKQVIEPTAQMNAIASAVADLF